jgi:Tol biopolymer transport system component
MRGLRTPGGSLLRRAATVLTLTAFAVSLALGGHSSASAGEQTTFRSSATNDGSDANAASGTPILAAGGNVVVFQSSATNLVRGDRNGQDDVFAFDRAAGTVTLVSAGTSTHPANGRSTPLAVSPNGRFVVFASTAGDLTSDAQPSPCPPGQECNVEIYLRDRAAGTTELVSRSAAGQPANLPSGAAAVSANGRYVAFASFATNLVAGDTNRAADIFLRDRVAGTTRRISTGPGGAQANGPSDTQMVSMTPDARFIAFSTTASNLAAHEQPGSWDVYVADRGTGTLRRVSGAGGRSLFPTISDNGRRVAFMTMAPLARGDRTGTWDIYVRSREGSTRIPLTTPSTARISGNGRYVAFPSNDPSLPGLPAGSTQAVVWDISAGRAIIASMAGESPSSGSSTAVWVSADGTTASFDSSAADLVPFDGNGKTDIILRLLQQPG